MIGDLYDVAKRLRFSGFAFAGILLMGTIGYSIIGGDETSTMDAFYMTAITISTIGFHEVVVLEGHPYGRLFTILLAFAGFGVLTYLLSNLVALFIEGDLRKTFTRKKMIKEISKMSDHYIICGAGRVGRNIAMELKRTERPFVIVDEKREVLEELVISESLNCLYIEGDGTEDQFLESIGARRAAGLFVTTGDDNTNLVICLTARQMNPLLKIVARSQELNNMKKMKRAGANRVVTPDFIGGLRMASEMLRPAATEFLDDMIRSKAVKRFEEIPVPHSYDGKKFVDLPLLKLKNTMVIAIHDGDEWIFKPQDDYEIKKNMLLLIITDPEERLEIERQLS